VVADAVVFMPGENYSDLSLLASAPDITTFSNADFQILNHPSELLFFKARIGELLVLKFGQG
jgi:hypothetical protein